MTAKPGGGLGRGLDALIPRASTSAPKEPPNAAGTADGSDVRRVSITAIRSGLWQPRRNFSADSLEELARSIREHGVAQPLLVRPTDQGYELIAGERRLRAATLAGLTDVPVRVLNVSDQEALELALIENLQREDLDPLEEAEGYRTLMEKFGLTQEQVAERVGRARTSVANALRLLSLPESVQQLIRERRLSAGHAKVLLSVTVPAEQDDLARRCVAHGWSVRELERVVARLLRGPRRRRTGSSEIPEVHLRDIEERLKQKFGSPVHVTPCRTLAGGRRAPGRIEVEYPTPDDLDRILLILGLSDDF
jgi:ParB family chromosome partitioning protein